MVLSSVRYAAPLISASFLRNGIELLIGDPAKTKQKLGWSSSVTFEKLVHLMMDAVLFYNNKVY